jgi:hypothetical protein
MKRISNSLRKRRTSQGGSFNKDLFEDEVERNRTKGKERHFLAEMQG